MVIELIGVNFGLKSYMYTWFYFGLARSASLHDKKFSYRFITATLKLQNSVGINILLIWGPVFWKVETKSLLCLILYWWCDIVWVKVVQLKTEGMRFRTWMTQFRTDVI